MIVRKNVRSTVKKPEMYYDDHHVYLVKNQVEVKENEGQDNEFIGYEVGEEIEYDKDEFLTALSTGQVSLSDRATAMEDMILEMSQVVYA